MFDSTKSGNLDIWVIEARGGRPQQITENPADDYQASWSKGGRWIYFTSNRGGKAQIWKMPAEGGKATQLTQSGAFYALESRDGQSLHYSRPKVYPSLHRGYEIWEIPAAGGKATPLPDFGGIRDQRTLSASLS